jgi:hypothetical protein
MLIYYFVFRGKAVSYRRMMIGKLCRFSKLLSSQVTESELGLCYVPTVGRSGVEFRT